VGKRIKEGEKVERHTSHSFAELETKAESFRRDNKRGHQNVSPGVISKAKGVKGTRGAEDACLIENKPGELGEPKRLPGKGIGGEDGGCMWRLLSGETKRLERERTWAIGSIGEKGGKKDTLSAGSIERGGRHSLGERQWGWEE